MRSLKILAATTAVALAPSVGHADEGHTRHAAHEPSTHAPLVLSREAQELADVLEERVTVWHRPDGSRVHVGHCRFAPRGCRARIEQLSAWMVEVAAPEHVDPWLIAAIAFRESGLNPWAVGRAGERGVLQLHPQSHIGAGVRFVRDERFRAMCSRYDGACQHDVLAAGAHLLAMTAHLCHDDVAGMLSAYNAGTCEGAPDYARRVLRERDYLHLLATRLHAQQHAN
jgi:hypothetical protein